MVFLSGVRAGGTEHDSSPVLSLASSMVDQRGGDSDERLHTGPPLKRPEKPGVWNGNGEKAFRRPAREAGPGVPSPAHRSSGTRSAPSLYHGQAPSERVCSTDACKNSFRIPEASVGLCKQAGLETKSASIGSCSFTGGAATMRTPRKLASWA